jgi:hypothetical protein
VGWADALEDLLAAVDERIAVLEGVSVDFTAEIAVCVACVEGVHVLCAARGKFI